MDTPERSEKLLALLLVQAMKESPQVEQIRQLRRAGLTNVEIADLLGTSSGAVAQAYYEASKPAKKKQRK